MTGARMRAQDALAAHAEARLPYTVALSLQAGFCRYNHVRDHE